jgi:hypothetical protein
MSYVEKLRWEPVKVYVWKLSVMYSSVIMNCSYALEYDLRKFSFLTSLISWKMSYRVKYWKKSYRFKIFLQSYHYTFFLYFCLQECLFVCWFAPSIIFISPISWYRSSEHELNDNRGFKKCVVYNLRTSGFFFNVVSSHTFSNFKKKYILNIMIFNKLTYI